MPAKTTQKSLSISGESGGRQSVALALSSGLEAWSSASDTEVRFGFVHVPKTGGTAVANAMFRELGGSGISYLQRATAQRAVQIGADRSRTILIGSDSESQLATEVFISGHLLFSDLKALQRNFIFSIVREPVSRVVSDLAFQHQLRAMEPSLASKTRVIHSARNLVGHCRHSMGTNGQLRRLVEGTPIEVPLLEGTDGLEQRNYAVVEGAIQDLFDLYDLIVPYGPDMSSHLQRGLGLPRLSLVNENVTEPRFLEASRPSRRQIRALKDLNWADVLLYDRTCERVAAQIHVE